MRLSVKLCTCVLVKEVAVFLEYAMVLVWYI